MDRGGDQLLARPALALDQHRGIRHRHLADHVLDLLHRGRRADELVDGELFAEARTQRMHLAAEEPSLHEPAHQVSELVEDQRLRQIVVRAFLQRLDRRRDRRVASHDHDLDRFVVRFDSAQEVEPAHVRHADVHQCGIEETAPDGFEGFMAGARAGGGVSPLAERPLEERVGPDALDERERERPGPKGEGLILGDGVALAFGAVVAVLVRSA